MVQVIQNMNVLSALALKHTYVLDRDNERVCWFLGQRARAHEQNGSITLAFEDCIEAMHLLRETTYPRDPDVDATQVSFWMSVAGCVAAYKDTVVTEQAYQRVLAINPAHALAADAVRGRRSKQRGMLCAAAHRPSLTPRLCML